MSTSASRAAKAGQRIAGAPRKATRAATPARPNGTLPRQRAQFAFPISMPENVIQAKPGIHSPAFHAMLAEHETQIQNERREHAIAYSRDGVPRASAIGTASRVDIPVSVDAIDGGLVTHQHPPRYVGEPALSFSEMDLQAAHNYRMGVFRAISPGFQFTITPGPNAPHTVHGSFAPSFFEKVIAPAIEQERMRAATEASIAVQAGVLHHATARATADIYNAALWHGLWSRMAARGLINYTVTLTHEATPARTEWYRSWAAWQRSAARVFAVRAGHIAEAGS